MDFLHSITGQSIALSFILLIYLGVAAGLVRLYLTATRDHPEDAQDRQLHDDGVRNSNSAAHDMR